MRAIPSQTRRDEMAQTLMRDGHIDASAQAEAYGVSRETIRKDLLYLERIGLARKGYGGAVVATGAAERSFSEKFGENQPEKQRIAAAALSMIQKGDVILLDSGSTVFALAKLLSLMPMDITIFTNSLESAHVLTGSGIPTYLLGGQIRPSSSAVTGAWAVRQLSELRVQKLFLGASGWLESAGPCVESFEEAHVKQAMIASAEQTILLADSTKCRRKAMLQFARWQEIDALVTDSGLDEDQRDSLSKLLKVIPT